MLSMFHKPETTTLGLEFDQRQQTVPMAPRLAPVSPARPANLDRVVPSVGQYLYHLSHDLKSFTRAETLNAVMGAKPAEIQRVAKIAAKLKGRYLAMVVDLGSAERGPVGELELRALERARFMYQEAQAGLEALRSAIESGDLELDGVRAAE